MLLVFPYLTNCRKFLPRRSKESSCFCSHVCPTPCRHEVLLRTARPWADIHLMFRHTWVSLRSLSRSTSALLHRGVSISMNTWSMGFGKAFMSHNPIDWSRWGLMARAERGIHVCKGKPCEAHSLPKCAADTLLDLATNCSSHRHELPARAFLPEKKDVNRNMALCPPSYSSSG